MIDYTPALSILGTFLLISLVLIYKFNTEQILRIFEGKNFFLLATLIIIFLLLAFYLFNGSEIWVGDLLKIAIGVFAGAGATSLKKNNTKKRDESFLSLNNSKISGEGNKFAGRDINETIHNIEEAFGDIKNSVINQNSKIEQILSSSGQLDHCIHIISREGNVFRNMQIIINRRLEENWTLQNIEFAFDEIDFVLLLFIRTKLNNKPEFTIFRNVNFEPVSVNTH
jgi:hypothetical protein